MHEILTALVLIASPDGAVADTTSGRLDTLRPSEGTIEAVERQLEDLGFEVYPGGPIALTIVGPVATFERVFDTTLEIEVDNGRPRVTAHSQLVVPTKLSPYVAQVMFPTPAQTFP